MKSLHHNDELFKEVIYASSEALGINPAIIEKDYFVTVLLQEIVKQSPHIVFKGGTSLSKCFRIINRFSEDIDLGINVSKATEGMRINVKKAVVKAIDNAGLMLENSEHIFSKRYYNKYIIQYPNSQSLSFIKPYLYVETALFMEPFPFETKQADTYIYRFLKQIERNDIIEEYNLLPFDINTQSLARTFIDKLFAVGDYYLSGKTEGHSRHLYDLYKITPFIIFDEKFFSLYETVRAIRQKDSDCPSAKNQEGLKPLLEDICVSDFFKTDYNSITKSLLFEDISYLSVKENLKQIVEVYLK